MNEKQIHEAHKEMMVAYGHIVCGLMDAKSFVVMVTENVLFDKKKEKMMENRINLKQPLNPFFASI